jgi:hypothetical protein
MTILEVTSLSDIEGFANEQPFIYSVKPGGLELATFWTSTFGAPDESRDYSIVISSFIRGFDTEYIPVVSFNDCVIQEGSFYWDNTNQILYIHFEHDQEGWTDTYQTGTSSGFSDNGMLYIDGLGYDPLIESVPSIAQQQDIANYSLPAFVNGSVILNNNSLTLAGETTGALDRFIIENVYGNSAKLYYYPDDKITVPNEGDRNYLVPLAALYVEDYDISLQEIDFRVQDIRKSDNIIIPQETFNTTDYPNIGEVAGEAIPLMYGQVREAKAIITNEDITSGNVTYRVALLLTVLGTVQVYIDELWTTVSTASVSLSSGEFQVSEYGDIGTTSVISDNGNGLVRITKSGQFTNTLPNQYANCVFSATYDNATYEILTVDGSGNYIDIDLAFTTAVPTVTASVYNAARNPNGSVRECRVLLPTGIAITYTSDVIKDLYLRYKGLAFITSNFDTTEWGVEEAALTSGGYVFEDQVELFEAIRIVQEGSVIGFRFEILPTGQRTFRIDDPDRAVVGRVEPVDIRNRTTMPVTTDSDQVFAEVVVKFNRSFNSGRYQRTTDNTFSESVLARYRQQNRLTVPDTMLNNSTDAETRALTDATRFSEIPKIMTLELMGGDFLPIRIFDIFDIEATPDFANADTQTIIGRNYYGFKKGKVIAVDPDIQRQINTVQFKLLED